MKVGKEEAIGMLTAVEMWVKRDHDAEWKQWMAWLDHISRRLDGINGVTADRHAAERLVESHAIAPPLVGSRSGLGFSGETVARTLFDTEPRVVLTTGQAARTAGGDRRQRHAIHDVRR